MPSALTFDTDPLIFDAAHSVTLANTLGALLLGVIISSMYDDVLISVALNSR
jgi:hypothetical protein